MAKLFLENVTKQTLPFFKKQHRTLFPIEYNTTFYDNFITDNSFFGYFITLDYEHIGVVSFKLFPGNVGYLMTFGISENKRRVGNGRRILLMVEESMILMNVKHVYLHVHSVNENGLSFYKNNGYVILKCEHNYYKTMTPSKAYMLEKKI